MTHYIITHYDLLQVAAEIGQIVAEVESIEEKIQISRKEGKTQAFNLNSLLIKPVQRVTKYPLLLEQVRIGSGTGFNKPEIR